MINKNQYMKKPVFSGHESFACKSHWLKRGYDFVLAGHSFNNEDAVVHLGVGKNMVNSIKFWMRAFGLLEPEGELTSIAHELMSDKNGYDPFFEDMGSLWLLHFNLINEDYATIYKSTFIDYHKQRNLIDGIKLQNFIKHLCFDGTSYKNLYNENTVKRDIGVLFHNYCSHSNGSIEESNMLLAPLNLIQETEDGMYIFNYDTRNSIPANIFLFALLVQFPDSKSISFEAMKDLALMFCLTNNDLLSIIKQLCAAYPTQIVFSDVAGIKELQIRENLSKDTILNNYYLTE